MPMPLAVARRLEEATVEMPSLEGLSPEQLDALFIELLPRRYPALLPEVHAALIKEDVEWLHGWYSENVLQGDSAALDSLAATAEMLSLAGLLPQDE